MTTSPDGYLAKSKAFAMTLKNHKFDIVEQEFHVDFDVNLNEVECIIQTDGGKEFTAHEFKKTINKLRYFQQITAPNSSWQNGMAEQPYCTIKEKM